MTRKFQTKHIVLLAVGVMIVVIIAISLAATFMLREKEIEAWRRQVSNLSLVMEEQTIQTMSSATIAMDSIAERIGALGIRSEAELRSLASTEAIHQIMQDKITGLTQVDVATIVAANGDVINFTRSFPAPAINLSDRDYFIAQRDTPALGMFISTPVQNKGNGKWVFYLSRRLNDSSGQFMGMVIIGISVDQLTKFYESLGKNLGDGSAITLYRNDFTVLARWPNKDETIGGKNLTGTTHRVVEELKRTEDVIYATGPRFSDSDAPVARLGSVRVLDHFPMILNVTITEEFFLTNWRHAATWIATVAGGSALALMAVMLVLLRLARQRERGGTLLMNLADLVPGMLFQCQSSSDGLNSFTYINQAGLKMYNLETQKLPIDAAVITAYLHPEDIDRIRASVEDAARTLLPWHEEYRLLLPDRGVIWRHGEAQPQKLKDGTTLWHGYITDISASKHAEDALRQSEDRLTRAELVSKSGNWELHLDTQVITASKGAIQIYGLNENQNEFYVVKKAPLPEYRPLLDSALRDLIEQNKPYNLEFKIRTADTGEIKDIHSVAIFDNEKRIVFGVIQDITEQSRIHHALKDEVQRRRIVFEQSRDGIALLRPDGSVVELNQAFAEMLDYSREELGQMNVRNWDIKFSQYELERITHTLGQGYLNIETQHLRKNGTAYDVEVSISGVEWGGESYLFCLHRDITERKQADEALRRSEENFRDFFEKNASVILLVDPATGRVIAANKAAINYYGYPAKQLVGMHTGEINALNPESLAEEELRSLREDRDCYLLSQRLASGEVRDVEVYLTPIERGGRQLLFSVVHDITGRIQAEAQLRLAATVFTHAREGILITEPNGTIIDVNETFGLITGYNRDEVKGLNPRLLSSGYQDKDFYVELWSDLIQKGYWSGEIWNRRKNGELYAEMLTISAVRDAHGTTRKYVALFSDITRLKEHERELRHMAHYDVLTALPNRVMLSDRLQQAMAQTLRRGQRLAVCYLDLDGFKTINDTYGHEAGDQLLIAVSNRMKGSLREGDTLARIGGDEFVAVLLDLRNEEASLPMLNRLIAAAAEPVSIGEIITHVSASLGVTYYPQEEEVGADQLLRQADQAMYQAKLAGKNRYHFFKVSEEHDL